MATDRSSEARDDDDGGGGGSGGRREVLLMIAMDGWTMVAVVRREIRLTRSTK